MGDRQRRTHQSENEDNLNLSSTDLSIHSINYKLLIVGNQWLFIARMERCVILFKFSQQDDRRPVNGKWPWTNLLMIIFKEIGTISLYFQQKFNSVLFISTCTYIWTWSTVLITRTCPLMHRQMVHDNIHKNMFTCSANFWLWSSFCAFISWCMALLQLPAGIYCTSGKDSIAQW